VTRRECVGVVTSLTHHSDDMGISIDLLVSPDASVAALGTVACVQTVAQPTARRRPPVCRLGHIDGQTDRFKRAGTSTIRENTVQKRSGPACLNTTARHGHGPLQRPARPRPAPSARSRHGSRWIPSPSDLIRPFLLVTWPCRSRARAGRLAR